MTTRTDIHRPSVIDPESYYFVGISHMKIETLEDCYAANINRERIQSHMEQTKGTYSQHAHGGNCHICGAHCICTAVFYHPETNTYIRTGFDCAEKMDMGDPSQFRSFRKSVQQALERKAGKTKAKAILSEMGAGSAWEIWENRTESTDFQFEETTICDIVEKLIRYGNLSDKQLLFIKSLLDKIERRAEIQAQREAEKAAAKEVPVGRHQVVGTVLKTRYQESSFGEILKMLVKTEDGYLLWGTVPSALQILEDPNTECQRGLAKGDRISFTAKLEPSKDDPKFGFYKRPTKAEVIEAVAVEI